MLVLTRQPGIGEESSVTLPELGIVIRILEVRSYNQVRLGIEAPSNVNILRTELIERPQIELGVDRALDCGSLGQITPNGLVDAITSIRETTTKIDWNRVTPDGLNDAIRAASVDDDCDAEPLPRYSQTEYRDLNPDFHET